MKDAFGTEIRVGQTIVVARGYRNHLVRGKVTKVVTTEWSWRRKNWQTDSFEDMIEESGSVTFVPEGTQYPTWIRNPKKVVVVE